ncbi:MAG: corrinoid protein [Candidatus Sulfobium sp.]|jgi:5-methyltetrahydrofolate--homocysteine methyltransferase
MEERNLIEEIRVSVVQGRINSEDEGFDDGFEGRPATVDLIEEAMKENVNIKDLVISGLTAGMDVVGRNFESGKYLIPDMLASAEAVGAAMDILGPHLEKAGIETKGRFVIATVKGDLHDIGKNIVSIMLKGAGFDVVDLGTDVRTEKIVEAAEQHKPQFLGLSALLTTTMREMENVIGMLDERGLRRDMKVLIGGAPTSRDFAAKIGADAHCADAFQAIEFTNSVCAV